MKNLMLIAVLLFAFGIQSCAQKSDPKKVPEQVLSAFKAKFPDVEKAKWERENDTEWEAEFKMDGIEYSASFTTKGRWKETENEIKKSEIPANISTILDQNFTDYDIEEAEMGEGPSGKFYEFEIETDHDEFEVMIDSQGKLTKQKDEDYKDDDED